MFRYAIIAAIVVASVMMCTFAAESSAASLDLSMIKNQIKGFHTSMKAKVTHGFTKSINAEVSLAIAALSSETDTKKALRGGNKFNLNQHDSPEIVSEGWWIHASLSHKKKSLKDRKKRCKAKLTPIQVKAYTGEPLGCYPAGAFGMSMGPPGQTWSYKHGIVKDEETKSWTRVLSIYNNSDTCEGTPFSSNCIQESYDSSECDVIPSCEETPDSYVKNFPSQEPLIWYTGVTQSFWGDHPNSEALCKASDLSSVSQLPLYQFNIPIGNCYNDFESKTSMQLVGCSNPNAANGLTEMHLTINSFSATKCKDANLLQQVHVSAGEFFGYTSSPSDSNGCYKDDKDWMSTKCYN